MRRGNEVSGGRSFAGRPTGQQYNAFHSALLSKCYPKRGGVSTSGAPVIVKTPQGDKLAGHVQTISDNPVFVKRVTVSEHLHRMLDAWGVDSRALDVLEARGVRYVRVVTDKGEVYTTTMTQFRNYGIPRDFGYGAQVFLPRRYWEVRG